MTVDLPGLLDALEEALCVLRDINTLSLPPAKDLRRAIRVADNALVDAIIDVKGLQRRQRESDWVA